MSADLNELYSAYKTAKEDFVLTKTAFEAGIAERLTDALDILCECQSALSAVALCDCQSALSAEVSPLSLECALREVRAIQRGLTDADPGDAERTESEVDNADD